jgi:membrane protease YdiL (CAAX protease family)
MWLLPFILLNKFGQREIGLTKPTNPKHLFSGILAGIIFCTLVWFIGDFLYGGSTSNWLVYISKSYSIPNEVNLDQQRLLFFIIFGVTSMIFSPIGEELMYRGMIHRCFSNGLGETKASYVDSSAFALTHLAHFGILFTDGNWVFEPLAALIWVILMFLASRVFFWAKQRSGSILGAILGHAFFNLTMTYFIFYHIF